MAWETMWKIGPECAAQHPKWVNTMAQKGQRAKTLRARAGRPAQAEAWVRPPARSLRSKAAGMTTSAESSASTTKAVRQSKESMSHRDRGERARVPSPLPEDTMAVAMPRRVSNQRITVTVKGT